MDFALETDDWKKNAEFLGKGGRREIYIYNGVIVKEIYNHRWNNLNLLDYNNYLILEKVILKSEYKINFIKLYFENNFIISEIVKDFDGKISQNLRDYKGIITSEFWIVLEKILKFLIDNELYFFDLNESNIIVKRISKTEIVPIFFEYKSFNRQYFLQLNLLFKSEKEKKFGEDLIELKLIKVN